MCILYNIEYKTYDMIMKDIEIYFEQLSIQDLNEKTKILSPGLAHQLNSAMFKEFINSFNLLEKMSTDLVKKLKYSSKISNKQHIVRYNEEINSI